MKFEPPLEISFPKIGAGVGHPAVGGIEPPHWLAPCCPLLIVGESGLIYLLIPLAYFWVFASALLLAAVFAIFKKTRFLTSPLTVGALFSILGLILSICEVDLTAKWVDTLQQRLMNAIILPNWLDFLCWTSPFAAALLSLLASYGAGFYLVLSWRRKRRVSQDSHSSPREAARTFREGALP